MKLSFVNALKGGYRQTNPERHAPTSDSHHEPEEKEDGDSNEVKDSLKRNEIVSVSANNQAPFRKQVDIRNPPNTSNIL